MSKQESLILIQDISEQRASFAPRIRDIPFTQGITSFLNCSIDGKGHGQLLACLGLYYALISKEVIGSASLDGTGRRLRIRHFVEAQVSCTRIFRRLLAGSRNRLRLYFR